MIVRKFLSWSQTATAGERAEGASALARAYLYADLSEQDYDDAELALTTLLEDPSPLVRRAMAEAFARAEDSPHHIVITLAGDQSEVSSAILSRSPLLSDVELVNLLEVGDEFAQSAIALRPNLSQTISTVLAEIGHEHAVLALAQNCSAQLSDAAIQKIVDRFGSNSDITNALLLRPNLNPFLRYEISRAIANRLGRFVTECGWISDLKMMRVLNETKESSAISIAGSECPDVSELIRHLRIQGNITPSFLLRSLLSGSKDIFLHAFIDLTQMQRDRVEGLIKNFRGSGFAALFAKAGLPNTLLHAFRAALSGIESVVKTADFAHNGALLRPLIAHVMQECAGAGQLDSQLMALLRRFEAEAARDAARTMAQSIVEEERNIASSQRIGIAAVAAALDVPMLFQDLSVDEYQVLDFAVAA